MKITVTGSLGNTSRPLTEKLVQAGHDVTVISSSEDKTAAIAALGAKAAIGSVEDVAFLTQAFRGADALYAMVPPNLGASDYRAYYASIGRLYAQAIGEAGVKQVVHLSSFGADQPGGTGPISGLYDVEQVLNAVPDIAVKHLRAGFFYVNYYNNIDMIRNMNFIGSNYGPQTVLTLVHPADVADAAFEEFQQGFTGKSVRYVFSDERNAGQVASALGAAIGKPDLPWIEFTDQQSTEGMEKAGMSAPMAGTFTEMGAAMRNGLLLEEYWKLKPAATGKVKLEEFAVEFAGKY